MKILHRKNKERKQIKKYKTASITAEAALLYPILILLLVFCLQKTLALYEAVRQTAEEIYTEETVDSADIFQKKVKAEQIDLKNDISNMK